MEVVSKPLHCTTVMPYLSSSVSRDFAASKTLQSRRVSPQSQSEVTVDAGENGHETDYMSVSVCLRNSANSEGGKFQIKEKKITERE